MDAEANAIKSDIEQTRTDMSETAHELGRRLQPGRIVKEFVDHSPTLRFVKRHPVSLTLLTIGTAIYFMEKRRPVSFDLHPDAAKESLREGMEIAKEKMSEGMQRVKEKVSDARESLMHTGESAREMATQSLRRGQQIYEANPIAVGAAALVAGAVLGWIIPITQREQRLMGETSRHLVDKAKQQFKETSQQVVADVKEYVGQVQL